MYKCSIDTQKRIYKFVKEYMEIHGYAPSYREISDGIYLKSLSSISNQIKNMLDNGSLETDLDASCPRGIRIGKDIWND